MRLGQIWHNLADNIFRYILFNNHFVFWLKFYYRLFLRVQLTNNKSSFWSRPISPQNKRVTQINLLVSSFFCIGKKIVSNSLWNIFIYLLLRHTSSLDKMADVSHTTFSNVFSLMKLLWLVQIALKFVPQIPFDNKSVLVQGMAWHQTGDKQYYLNQWRPGSLRYIFTTRPQ